jgi:beta-mannanase
LFKELNKKGKKDHIMKPNLETELQTIANSNYSEVIKKLAVNIIKANSSLDAGEALYQARQQILGENK